ncbi:hypothetical protein BJP34_35740 (plasmid) [Moorena producens PAL-8-15-08-1]|uniref:Uncharacterized protein n=1 Tax=Moorena producens PAL-8-15-08-1 TaxID=1458985 RepID=A0A1D8U4Q0_9CYAN|nr:hypothetical protein [Moorena producens]AOX04734.1 hypothetical protein BJP34_35740 [Moorena producens PAL-8-15-08-1]
MKQLRYNIPKGYKPWKEIYADVKRNYQIYKEAHMEKLQPYQYTQELASAFVQLRWVLEGQGKLYTITKDLMTAFSNTEVSETMFEGISWKDSEAFCLLPPIGSLVSSMKIPIDWIAFSMSDKAVDMDFKFMASGNYRIGDTFFSWAVTWGIRDGSLVWHDTETFKAKDQENSRKIRNLVMQILIAQRFHPELFVQPKYVPGQGFSGKPKEQSPIIIGANYKLQKKTETGTSKAAHFRRGHYRNQPYGEGRSQRKLIWIEPVWVGL